MSFASWKNALSKLWKLSGLTPLVGLLKLTSSRGGMMLKALFVSFPFLADIKIYCFMEVFNDKDPVKDEYCSGQVSSFMALLLLLNIRKTVGQH